MPAAKAEPSFASERQDFWGAQIFFFFLFATSNPCPAYKTRPGSRHRSFFQDGLPSHPTSLTHIKITATMSAENLDIPVAYEQLEDLEDDFEDVEMELRKLLFPWLAP